MDHRPFIFDMETGDPDDFLTLALLCGHPRVNLIAVTVTPGTPHQVGVVRRCLEMFKMDIPVGAFDIGHRKNKGMPDERYVKCVSSWHYKTFGDIPPSEDAEEGWKVLYRLLRDDTTLVTGGPLKNLGALLANWEEEDKRLGVVTRLVKPRFGRLFAQGGFAGTGVVPPEHELPQFQGRVTCPTYNLNGDPKSAEAVIACPHFSDKRFVSKNVCHDVVYDEVINHRLNQVKFGHLGLQILHRTMGVYPKRQSQGKKLHDLLAACCAIEPDIGTWAEVELYRDRGQWGSRLKEGTGVHIITGYDKDRFLDVLTETL